MADNVTCQINDGKRKRHYCCVCSNYRRKMVNGKTVTLHRFPANKQLQRAWLRRIRNVSSQFRFSEKNDRLCSAHFSDGKLSGKHVPTIFTLNDGRIKMFETDKLSQEEFQADTDDKTNSVDHQEDSVLNCEEQVCVSDDCVVNEAFCCESSFLQASVVLHDYCGTVDQSTLSTTVNKCVQTCPSSTMSVNCSMQTELTSTRSVSCQTDEINDVKNFKDSATQVNTPDLTFEDISMSNEKCMFYTGVPNAETFQLLFDEMGDAGEHTHRAGSGENTGRPRILRPIDEFFLVLIRLRLGLLLEDLADRFRISKSTCSNITNHWISYLHVKLSFLVAWPSRMNINQTMPNKFKIRYPDCRIIIDCTEIYTETPQSQSNKTLMYSHYKSHMTYKSLLGISPAGVITFVSDLWSGSVSDKQLTERCGILDACESGDSIMADKGFLISDLTIPRGINLIIPPLKRSRFSRRQVEETRRIANLRIDVERAMERVKNFRILQGVIPITISKQASKIWKICACLSNLQPPLVHDEEE